MAKYEYIVSEEGIIFRKCKKGLKEVNKRLGYRGVLEFKMNGKTTSYRKFVATALIPNPDNCDKVFCRDGNPFNTHPSNLYWWWTREGKTFTPEQAISRCKDAKLIDAYKSGNVKNVVRLINNFFEKQCFTKNFDLMTETYLLLVNYAERNLIFDIKKDFRITFRGLLKMKLIREGKQSQFNEKYLFHNK